MRNVLLGVLWATVAVPAASGQVLWEPPNVGTGVAFPIVMVDAERIPTITIGTLTVVLDETSLAATAARFKAPVGHRGDASESLEWFCLTGQDPRGRWLLWFESGEIHGHDVGAFQIRRIAANDRVDSRCRKSTATVQNPAGLRLGMSRDEVRKIFGGANSTQATMSYVHQHAEANDFNLESIVSVELSRDVVVAFEVWKTVSN